MLVNLNDPDSILAWWKVWPARHDPYLDWEARTCPQFATSIREVQRRIAASPELCALLAKSVREGRERTSSRSAEAASLSAYELRMAEFAQ